MESLNNEGKDFFCFTVLYWCVTTAVLELLKTDGISGASPNVPNMMVPASQASAPRMSKSQFYD